MSRHLGSPKHAARSRSLDTIDRLLEEDRRMEGDRVDADDERREPVTRDP